MIHCSRNNLMLLVTCVYLAGAVGCASLSHHKYELTQKITTRLAWSDFDPSRSPFSAYSCDFKSGWQAGYYSVLTGGDGRPPVLPPRKYWNPPLVCYRAPCAQDEWIRGFRTGAAAARRFSSDHYINPFLSDPGCDRCSTCMTQTPLATDQGFRIEPQPEFEASSNFGAADEFDSSQSAIRLLGTIIPIDPNQQHHAPPMAVPANEPHSSDTAPSRELSLKLEWNSGSGDGP